MAVSKTTKGSINTWRSKADAKFPAQVQGIHTFCVKNEWFPTLMQHTCYDTHHTANRKRTHESVISRHVCRGVRTFKIENVVRECSVPSRRRFASRCCAVCTGKIV